MSEHGARVLMERKEKKQNKRLMIQQFSTAYPHGLLEVLQRNSGEEEGVCGADALERRAGPPGEKATLDNDSRVVVAVATWAGTAHSRPRGQQVQGMR